MQSRRSDGDRAAAAVEECETGRAACLMLRVQLTEALDDCLEVLEDPSAKWSDQVRSTKESPVCFNHWVVPAAFVPS